MLSSIIGSKGKMNQGFIEGRRVPVTKIIAGPCTVTQIKRQDTDGYWAVQLGFGTRKTKNLSKALLGHLAKSTQNSKLKTQNAPRHIAEIRLDKEPEFNVGDVINASDIFKTGDIISVSGVSKGKGFAGVVKRHHFAGGPRTHGQSDRERAPGSIGQTTTPGRVYKGKKMGGRMGGAKVTVKNLQVISVDAEKNEIEVSGPVPGITEGILVITKLAAGKLEGIQEVQAQVVEGEAEAGTEPASADSGEAKGGEEKPQEAPKAEVKEGEPAA